MQIGQKMLHLASVDSTNNYAANLLKQGDLEHGTVILADEQYAGRGQRGAEWLVKPGENLTFSFFLSDVNLSVNRQFVLTQLVSLGMVDFLRKFGIEASIKWPNDIYVGDSKICGMLIENQLSGSSIKSSIIGIGLNVNQEAFSGFSATSLKLVTGKQHIIQELIFSLIFTLNEMFKENLNRTARIDERYHENLYRRDEMSDYEDASGKFQGVIKGVSPEGRLIVLRDHKEYLYELKEIRFV